MTASLPVHPRLRARRIAVRRNEGRRRLRRLVLLVVIISLIGLGWGAVRSPLLDVDTVEVAGASRTGAEAVMAASGIEPGEPLASIDAGAAEAAVAALPWIATAEIRRDWPGTVTIEVTERTPVAVAAGHDGGWAVLDVAGRVLAVEPEPVEGLPVVMGLESLGPPGSQVADEAGALEVVAILPEALRSEVASVRARGRDLVVELRGGGEVRMGPPTSLEDKVLAVATVLEEVEVGSLAVLDVTVPSSPVVTRR